MSTLLKILVSVTVIAILIQAIAARYPHTEAFVATTTATDTIPREQSSSTPIQEAMNTAKVTATSKVVSLATLALRTNADWQKILTPDQFAVLRQQGTEIPYTSDLLHEKRKGTYVTADCGEPVFRSEQKFDSGTGWPSFYAPIKPGAVVISKDDSLGTVRDEVSSSGCKSHLGHVFHDAPQTPTGDRYCMNGVALRFIPDAVQ